MTATTAAAAAAGGKARSEGQLRRRSSVPLVGDGVAGDSANWFGTSCAGGGSGGGAGSGSAVAPARGGGGGCRMELTAERVLRRLHSHG